MAVAGNARGTGPQAAHVRDYWGMLTREEQSTLRARTATGLAIQGEDIHVEGAPVDQVAIVRSGWAKATVNKAGRSPVLRLYGPGELIGVAAVLTGADSAETITVISGGLHMMSLPARSFADFLHRAPHASSALHHVQLARLLEADRLRTIRDYPTASQRLAGLLVELCRPENGPIHHTDGLRITVPGGELSQGELGSWIGDSRKTVVRALAELRAAGLVSCDLRRHVTIEDTITLRRFADAADDGSALPA